jgi:hypothetical protein
VSTREAVLVTRSLGSEVLLRYSPLSRRSVDVGPVASRCRNNRSLHRHPTVMGSAERIRCIGV